MWFWTLCCTIASHKQANICTVRCYNLVVCDMTRLAWAYVEISPPPHKHPRLLSWFSFRLIQVVWLSNRIYLMNGCKNGCEDDCKGQSHYVSAGQLCTPRLPMVDKRLQALLASSLLLLLLLLCLDASLVSSSTEDAEMTTKGFVDIVSIGANRSLLKCAKESNSCSGLSLLILLLSRHSMVSVRLSNGRFTTLDLCSPIALTFPDVFDLSNHLRHQGGLAYFRGIHTI